MSGSDLAFFTTGELIAELVQRQTFLGAVVQAVPDHRGDWEGEKSFRVHFNSHLTPEEIGRLLGCVSESLVRTW